MELSFDGRVVIVTGAGSGLGADAARAFASRGARVLVNNRLRGEVDKAARTAAEITAAGGQALANHDDPTSSAGGEALVAAAREAFGRVDVVLHAAGVLRDRSLAKLSDEELDQVLDVHLRGAFHVARPAYRAMREADGGCLLWLSSAAGIFGNPGQANYAAAKAGLGGLSAVLALEGARHGVRSLVVSPYALTPATEAFLPAFGAEFPVDRVTPLLLALAAPGCARTGEVFSAGGGHYARVVTGLTPGWTAPRDAAPTPEQVAERLADIAAADELWFPDSAQAEIRRLVELLEG